MRNYDIVVIGASAGGIAAISDIFKGFSRVMNLPIVVVVHRGKDGKRSFGDFLQKISFYEKVKDGESGDQVRADCVYLAPPGLHLLVEKGRLKLSDTELVCYVRPSIDVLFKSVADAYGERAIGIILSGTGRDGSDGVKAIKEKGGVVIVQDEATSLHFAMPKSAIATGCVDFVLPVKDIPGTVEKLIYGN